MKFNALTLMLRNFITAFSGGSERVAGIANALLAALAVIDVVLIGMWWALDGGERLSAIFRKILYTGFWIWVVKSFPALSKSFVESLVSAGQIAGGGTGDPSLMFDPSRIAGYGLDATEPLAKKIEDLSVTQFADGLVYGVGYLAIVACFLFMAIHVFLAVLEYYLITAVVGVLLPFGLLKSTKFLAEKAIGAVVAVGIKLMVMSFILTCIEPVLKNSMQFSSEDVPMNELFAMFLTVCALMLLTWKAPSLASSLIAGHPTLGAGDATSPFAAAAGMAVGAATAGASYMVTKAAASAGVAGSSSTAGSSTGRAAQLAAFASAQGAGSPKEAQAPKESAVQSASQATGGKGPSATGADRTLVMSCQQPCAEAPVAIDPNTRVAIPASYMNRRVAIAPLKKG